MENDAIYQELTESERLAKDALLLQARDLSRCCRSRVFFAPLCLTLYSQHEEHLGGGGFSSKDEVRFDGVRFPLSKRFQRVLQSERRRAIEVGAGAEPEGDLEEDDDDD